MGLHRLSVPIDRCAAEAAVLPQAGIVLVAPVVADAAAGVPQVSGHHKTNVDLIGDAGGDEGVTVELVVRAFHAHQGVAISVACDKISDEGVT